MTIIQDNFCCNLCEVMSYNVCTRPALSHSVQRKTLVNLLTGLILRTRRPSHRGVGERLALIGQAGCSTGVNTAVQT